MTGTQPCGEVLALHDASPEVAAVLRDAHDALCPTCAVAFDRLLADVLGADVSAGPAPPGPQRTARVEPTEAPVQPPSAPRASTAEEGD